MSEYIQKQPSGNPIVAYGQQSAHYLLARARLVPPAERKAAVKTVLDAVDPTLYARASARADKAMAIGIPPAIALERGLAAAMSDGILRELMKVGAGKQAPARRSLLGLGCFGCGAVLGDIAENLTSLGAVTREHRGVEQTGPHKVPPKIDTTAPSIVVGPFVFGVHGGGIVWHKAQALPQTWQSFFTTEIGKLKELTGPKAVMGAAGALGLDKWLGLPTTLQVPRHFFDGTLPAFKTTNPVEKGDWGIYFLSTPTSFGIAMRKVPAPERSLLGKIWNGIKSIPSRIAAAGEKLYDYAKDAAKFLKEQACKMVNNHPDAVAAAATAGGMAAGGPAGGAAAQVGVGIVAGLCVPGAPDEVINEDAAAKPGGLLPLLLLGGAGAAFLLFTQKGHH